MQLNLTAEAKSCWYDYKAKSVANGSLGFNSSTLIGADY
jgi:hypothetical protein